MVAILCGQRGAVQAGARCLRGQAMQRFNSGEKNHCKLIVVCNGSVASLSYQLYFQANVRTDEAVQRDCGRPLPAGAFLGLRNHFRHFAQTRELSP